MTDLLALVTAHNLNPRDRGSDEYAIACPNFPAHASDDASESARLNIASGLWHCSGCKTAGNESKLRELLAKNGPRPEGSRHRRATGPTRPPISLAVIAREYEEALTAELDEPTLELLQAKAIDPTHRIFGVRRAF